MPPRDKLDKPVVVDELHWKRLAQLPPDEVAARCRCQWDPKMGFSVEFLGEGYWVDPRCRTVTPHREKAPFEPYLALVLVVFLLKASDIPLENQMVNEKEIPGGELFFRHLHSLPSTALEDRFGSSPREFVEAAKFLGARSLDISPASVELTPLPRVPVAVHLWPADEEFPARCTFTFDASIHRQLPLDVIWALVHVMVQRILWVASNAQG